MINIDFAKEILGIAQKAGEAIMDIYNNASDFGMEAKSDDSPVTIADKAANTIICDALAQLPVQFPIISEENASIPYATRKDFEYCWMVDPLDGTKEFINKNDDFTVNIALLHHQRPILGVVYIPVTQTGYFAVANQGAFKVKNGLISPIQVDSTTSKDSPRILCSRSHLTPATQAYIEQFEQPQLIARGSSLKFLLIAEGQADLYPRLGPTSEWDTAAADIVVTEAGGQVLQWDNNQPLVYNKASLKNPFFIVKVV